MKPLNLPPSWRRMGFTDKAAWLCLTKQAKNYFEACSMLAKRKRIKPAAPVQGPARKIRYPYNND